MRTRFFAQPVKHTLNSWDILILTVIFFGQAIVTSTLSLLDLWLNDQTAPVSLGFNQASNLWGIAFELISLLMAAAYLIIRRFDFRQLHIQINQFTMLWTMVIIITADMAAGLYDVIYLQFINKDVLQAQMITYDQAPTLGWDWVSYSLLNGFYEEVFFLGLLFCVPQCAQGLMYAYSLLVRFSFHTYQGISSAIAIALLGGVFLLFRRKLSTLVPFMLAHSFFDLFGLGTMFHHLLAEL